tara:strand:+ start:80 stop:511 length:432 start_codon:yes stop_codon:yes gene_type:complete
MKTSHLRQLIRETIKSSVNEGKGQDLADKYVAQLRQEFKNLNDDELDEFKKTLATAFDMNESVNEENDPFYKSDSYLDDPKPTPKGWSIINGIKFDNSFFAADSNWMVENKLQLSYIINRNLATSNILQNAKEQGKMVTISLT